MSPSASTWATVRASSPQLQQFLDADDRYLFRHCAQVTGALRMVELRSYLVTRPCDRPIGMPARSCFVASCKKFFSSIMLNSSSGVKPQQPRLA